MQALIAWDGVLKVSTLQDLAIGRIVAVVALALQNLPYKDDLLEPLEEVCRVDF